MHKRLGFEYLVPAGSRSVSVFFFSEGGTIQVQHNLGFDSASGNKFNENRVFRPESPVFNTLNTVSGGNILLDLIDVVSSPVLNLTFVNTTNLDELKVGFALGFDANPPTNGEPLEIPEGQDDPFILALRDTLSCYIVLRK